MRVQYLDLNVNLLDFSCSCLIEEDGASFSDSFEELSGLSRLSKAVAAAAAAVAFASAFIAKGDLICKGYCGRLIDGGMGSTRCVKPDGGGGGESWSLVA